MANEWVAYIRFGGQADSTEAFLLALSLALGSDFRTTPALFFSSLDGYADRHAATEKELISLVAKEGGCLSLQFSDDSFDTPIFCHLRQHSSISFNCKPNATSVSHCLAIFRTICERNYPIHGYITTEWTIDWLIKSLPGLSREAFNAEFLPTPTGASHPILFPLTYVDDATSSRNNLSGAVNASRAFQVEPLGHGYLLQSVEANPHHWSRAFAARDGSYGSLGD